MKKRFFLLFLLLLGASFFTKTEVFAETIPSACATQCSSLTSSQCLTCLQSLIPSACTSACTTSASACLACIASQSTTGGSGEITNPVVPSFDLGVLIGNLVAMGIIIASILVLLYFVIGGVEWIMSAGDKAALESARNRLTNALIGLVIVVASWAIMTMVSTFLGLSFPCLPIPTLSGIKSTCSSGGGNPGGQCTTKDGKPGEQCSNTNKCDINGGCNGACCQSDNDCLLASGKKQNCPALSNGYCKSGKSCQQGTEH